MPLTLRWPEIALRLALTALGGALLGANRAERGRPAGLRTTLLVCLAASISMIQVNLLLGITGKTPASFAVMDLMRLPLGILTGVGFIGAGTILRRDSMVIGVTTAATLWFVTVMGLCFGGGQIGLGLASLVLGWLVLSGLKKLEAGSKHECRAVLTLVATSGGPGYEDIISVLATASYEVSSLSISYSAEPRLCETKCEVRWEGKPNAARLPPFVNLFSENPAVLKVDWHPLGSLG